MYIVPKKKYMSNNVFIFPSKKQRVPKRIINRIGALCFALLILL